MSSQSLHSTQIYLKEIHQLESFWSICCYVSVVQTPSETRVCWDDCSFLFLSLSHYEDVNFKYTEHGATHKR